MQRLCFLHLNQPNGVREICLVREVKPQYIFEHKKRTLEKVSISGFWGKK
jgi:hypothetical protein